MREEERVDERIKYVERLHRMTRGAFELVKAGCMQYTRRQGASGAGDAEREEFFEKVGTRGST